MYIFLLHLKMSIELSHSHYMFINLGIYRKISCFVACLGYRPHLYVNLQD